MGQFVFICNFLSPSKAHIKGQRTLASIGRHIDYIATRPGVALNEETKQMEELQQQTTDSKKDISDKDYFQDHEFSPLTGSEADKDKQLDKYIQYIHERPKSHGLFGPDEDIIPNISETKEKLLEHKGLVWTSIISLSEHDAIKLGYTNKEAWERAIRTTVTDAAGVMGIRPTNLDYVAAYHQKQGHPHVHLVFWEKDPDRTRGKLSEYEMKNVKKTFIKELYADENSRLYAQKTAVRDYIRNVAKDDLIKTVDFIRGLREAGLEVQALNGNEPGIAPIFRDDKQRDLYIKLMSLAEKLPNTGRIMLKYMPQEVKDEVRNISDWLLSQPGMIKSVDQLKDVVREIASHYSNKPEALKEAEDKAYSDVRDRVSQVLLKAAVEGQKDSIFTVNLEKAQKAVDEIKNSYKPLLFDKEKELSAKTFIAALAETNMTRDDISNQIASWNESTQAGMTIQQINKIKDYIVNTKDITFASLEHIQNASEYKKAKIIAATLKSIGYDKEASVDVINNIFADKLKAVQQKIDKLVVDGYLTESDKQYDMSDKLKPVLIKTRVPDKLERVMLTSLKDKATFTIKDMVKDKSISKHAGEIYSRTREFKFGKYDANVVFKLFKNNMLTSEQLRENIFEKYTDENKAEEEFKNLSARIEKLAVNGYIEKDLEEGIYTITQAGLNQAKIAREAFEFTSYDASVLFKYIEKSNGSLTKETLDELLAEEYKDPEDIKKQLDYLIRRYDKNVEISTIELTPQGEYKITDYGYSEADNILAPYKQIIEKKLSYLAELGILSYDIDKNEYQVENKDLLDKTLNNKYLNLKDKPFDKQIYNLIEESHGHINAAEIEKRNQEYINGIVKDFEDIKVEYNSIRDQYRVQSTISRVLEDMSKVLICSGLGREEALNIITDWNERSGMKIDKQVIEDILDKSINARFELNEWNREQVISISRWKELFNDLGMSEDKIPKWMYEGQFTKHSASMLNKIWKAAFRAVEKECAKSEAQAEILKKQDIKQHQLENKDNKKELIRKMKTKTMFEEQDFER